MVIRSGARSFATSAASALLLIACRTSDEPAVATHLRFDQQPYASAASTQPLGNVTVALLTSHEHTVVGGAVAVQLSLIAANGAHLLGTISADAVNGVATFSDLNVDIAGTGYKLVAKALGLDSAVSQPFEVTLGSPAKLRFDSIEVPSRVGDVLPPVSVRVLDAGGNFLPTATTLITLGSPGSLSGTTVRAAVGGTAVFGDLVLFTSGDNKWLYADAPNLDRAFSNFFIVAPGPCAQLSIGHISDGHVGLPLTAFLVVPDDQYGNACVTLPPGGAATYAVTLGNNPSGATLSGRLTVNGFAVSTNIDSVLVDKSGTGYTLIVQSRGMTGTSNPFDIAP